MDTILAWATVASPIIGAIAIIVALIIGHHSSKEARRQVEAIQKLFAVFVASQAPTLIEARRKYEKQLDDLESKIEDAEEKLQIVSPFGYRTRMEIIEEQERKKEQKSHLDNLKQKRKEVQQSIMLIQNFMDNSSNNNI